MNAAFLEMTLEQLCEAAVAAGQPAYRAEQLADWVYRKGVTEARQMTNLPAGFVERFAILTSRVVKESPSRDGAVKLLLEFEDGQQAETVLIPTARRATACLSTQIGCGMGCAFCATGLDGFRRNLTASEILQQILHLRRAAGRRVTHVVFMGMGEPLANYEATMAAVRAIVDPQRFGISARAVTISTVGLPKQIRRLAKEDLPVTLAISLHGPNDALRRQLMPLAARYSLEDILAAAQDFYASRKREVTLEYVLLGGLNDTNVCAEALAQIARRLRCTVNLIPYNPVASLPYRRPAQAAGKSFAERLCRRGVRAHLRRERGLDVDAACGQLRQRLTLQQQGTAHQGEQ